MKLCQRCIDAIKQVVDVAYHWTAPYSGDPVPELECEFPTHRLLEKSLLIACRIYHPDNGRYADLHYHHNGDGVKQDRLVEIDMRPEPNTTTQKPGRDELEML